MKPPAADPIALLCADRAQAFANDDPMANLCLLATVDDGEPQARMLVLRDVAGPEATGAHSDSRLGIFLNRTSPKFRQIPQSATVAFVVYLPSLSVQYRLQGSLEPVPAAIVATNWQLRPPIPKRLDWLYQDRPQSAPIDRRERLVQLLERPDPAAAPDSALGYYLLPQTVERLDLAQPNGIHDRRRYTLGDQGWRQEILVP